MPLKKFVPAVKTGATVAAKPGRKPMSDEAKAKIRDAQLRRHAPTAAQATAPKPSIPAPCWKASE
jgi:hypothetical protein